MSRLNYSMEPDARGSRAMGIELHISPKHAREILRTIRGMNAVAAMNYLEDVVAMRKAVPFRRYNRNVAHRKGLTGWDAGRYPQKAAREMLSVLVNAIHNAEYKGLSPNQLSITCATTKKGRTIRAWFPRAMGRATPKSRETVTVEMILSEVS